ncbi:hypothetical protein Tco_0280379, partial [Tanacetum coccineum]
GGCGGDVGGGVGCGGTAAGEEGEGKTRVRASDHGERVDPVERRPFGVGRKTPSEKFSGGGGVVVAGMLAGEDDRRWRQLGGGRRWSPENFSGGGNRWLAVGEGGEREVIYVCVYILDGNEILK